MAWFDAASQDLETAVSEDEGPYQSEGEIPDLDLVSDEVGELVQQLVAAGADIPAIGREVGSERWPIEAAWPEEKVGLVLDDHAPRDDELKSKGWTLRVVDLTSHEEMLGLLRGES